MGVIRTAIVGVGNCASSLVQGIERYRKHGTLEGMIHEELGFYTPADVEFVLAIDVDARKVGKDLSQAVFAMPNCTEVFFADVPATGVEVMMGRVLDGVADHMQGVGERGFIVADKAEATKDEVVAALKASGAEVMLNYLPVGSQKAVEFYMECALEAGVGVVNCMPVFIASDPKWERRFAERGLPIVGDDVKAQLGATILHRAIAKLFGMRGVSVDRCYQLNTGGNTDFMNMLDRERLSSKKRSKTEAVQSMLAKRLEADNIHIGPSDYIPWQNDNKVCFLRIEGRLWGGVPMEVEVRLSVEDSPNSAAVVMDALRCCKLALDRGEGGVLVGPSAFYCKHPPRQIPDEAAAVMVEEFTSIPVPVTG